MKGPYTSLTIVPPNDHAIRGIQYERVSTEPLPARYVGGPSRRDPVSQTPHADAITRGDFSYYPSGIYDHEPLYIPRYQPSLVWDINRIMGPASDPYRKEDTSGRPFDGFKYDPSAFSMKTGGKLPPRFARYEPPDMAPGPLGPHPGLSYVQCDSHRNAVNDPPGMAPERYYR
jgi:hypothetical protein